jgi:putative ABC transport system substrate-binding protein
VNVLFAAGGTPSAFAAKATNATIPIVFSAVNHPVELGLVTSLNRPGGNVIGMSMFTAEIAAKKRNSFERNGAGGHRRCLSNKP